MKTAYFLRDTLLGQGEATVPVRVDGDWIFPSHVAFCCGYCGDIWGRMTYGNAEGRRWQFVSRPCEKHTDQMQARTAGSLVLMDREVDELPPGLGIYEFNLWLRKLDKGIL